MRRWLRSLLRGFGWFVLSLAIFGVILWIAPKVTGWALSQIELILNQFSIFLNRNMDSLATLIAMFLIGLALWAGLIRPPRQN